MQKRRYLSLKGSGTPRNVHLARYVKHGSFSIYEGFSIPEGLRRHLIGWGSQVSQCGVMEATVRLAREYWDRKFHEAEQIEKAEKHARTEQRKKTEVLYRTSPDPEPKLIDENLGYSATARSTDGLAWVEKRIMELGFQVALEGNIKSYTKEYEGFVVYADPRAEGEIEFAVYKKPIPKRNRFRPDRSYLGRFLFKDNWKNDIQRKYESRVAQITTTPGKEHN